MSLNYRHMLLYLWVTLLGYILVLNLILYLNQQQLYFLGVYQQYGDASYLNKYYFFLQSMYLVILLPVFVISPMFGKIILIFKHVDDTKSHFSLFTVSEVSGILIFIGLYLQALFSPSIEPSQVMVMIVCPFYFLFTWIQFQIETKK